MRKRVVLILVVGVSILFARGLVQYGRLTIETASASQHIEMMLQAEKTALAGTPIEAAKQLDFIVNYYPSGSRLRSGGRMDRLVETVRSNSLEHVLRHLRKMADVDLGDDPQAWIEGLK